MKTKRNWLAATFLTILLMSLTMPLIAPPTSASDDDDIGITPGTWYKLESDIVTVLFPAGGKKPMFIWWYTGEPDQIYVVKFEGLIEYFTFFEAYYKRKYEAFPENLHELFIKPRWGWLPWGIQNALVSIYEGWHLSYLPFSACNWTLTEPEPIKTTDGKVIGYAFAFKLNRVPMPRFKFAENNIMIKVRFYNTTVTEQSVDNLYKYNVTAGEMKMDIVINKWEWNIDLIKPLVSDLQKHGITIPEYKSGLALQINLASINITRIAEAMLEPDNIELWSTTSYMMVEGRRVFVKRGYTGTEDEQPIDVPKGLREHFKLQFATEDKTLAGFFKFVASAKMTNATGSYAVPVNASYIEAGAHMKLFIGYPYFGNGTLEHDPSIGVDVPKIEATPQYTVEAPSGTEEITPTVIGKYVPSLFTPELAMILVVVASMVAAIIYIAKTKRKTPLNMVGAG